MQAETWRRICDYLVHKRGLNSRNLILDILLGKNGYLFKFIIGLYSRKIMFNLVHSCGRNGNKNFFFHIGTRTPSM